MRAFLAVSLLALICPALSAQSPEPAVAPPTSRTYFNPLGFSYSLPADWQVAELRTSSPQAEQDAVQHPAITTEKKSMACAQIILTARHGDPVSAPASVPASVIDLAVLPFDCYGQQLTQDDLPRFGAGASDGIVQNFDIAGTQIVSYALGVHRLWAERVHGSLKGQPDRHYTVEISCALLNKAAVCWTTMAADPASLATFENLAVTLEDDSPSALVPAGTFK